MGILLVAQSMGLDYLGPFGFNAGRFLLGALVLIPVCLLWQRGRSVTGQRC
ncbi:hypothetical protein [Aliamphritea spongicola]|nr:hypothetical protein [Aliamphritea spongicola]